jgi:signal transduction histidine kinase
MYRRAIPIVLGTLALNTAIAVMLVVMGVSAPFSMAFVQSQSIGITISVLCWGVTPWVERADGAPSVALPLYAGAIIVGSTAGALLSRVATDAIFGGTADAATHGLAGRAGLRTLLLALVAGTLVTMFVYGRHRLRHAQTAAQAERWRAVAADRSAAQAQLQALRAQVEPHFLFNTLANVSALIDRDPAAARALVDDLARHLRATLRHARADATTLGEELDVTASLLGIMKRRLGDRLEWRFEVPDALRAVPVAPMLVQPLVENAVKHGIEPATRGGTITVRAQGGSDGALTVEVIDTGVGLSAGGEPDFRRDEPAPAERLDDGRDGGTGLANLGERLRAIYGPAARLALSDNRPIGTIARLSLPPLASPPT